MPDLKDRWVVVVDGYSAGNLLAPEFKTRGFRVAHVQSTPEIWKVLAPTFRPDDYEKNFAFDGNLEKLVGELRQLTPLGVVPGTETGTVKVTPLAEYPAKGRATGGVRCHKLRSGEDRLILAWAGTGPARAATVSGGPLALPDPDPRRDATGVPGTAPIASVAGAL